MKAGRLTVQSPRWLSYGLLLLLLFLAGSGSLAATNATNGVTVNPRTSLTNPGVTYKNAYGSLNFTTSQVYTNQPGVFTNGTITFDVSTTFAITIYFTYKITSYGNGTFTVRFLGPQPGSIQTTGHSASYSSSLARQDVLYSGGDAGYGGTSDLIVSFIQIGHVLRDAAFIMALF